MSRAHSENPHLHTPTPTPTPPHPHPLLLQYAETLLSEADLAKSLSALVRRHEL